MKKKQHIEQSSYVVSTVDLIQSVNLDTFV